MLVEITVIEKGTRFTNQIVIIPIKTAAPAVTSADNRIIIPAATIVFKAISIKMRSHNSVDQKEKAKDMLPGSKVIVRLTEPIIVLGLPREGKIILPDLAQGNFEKPFDNDRTLVFFLVTRCRIQLMQTAAHNKRDHHIRAGIEDISRIIRVHDRSVLLFKAVRCILY